MHYRALEPNDVDWLMEMENDPSHWTVGDRQVPLSRHTLSQYIANAAESLADAGQFRWVIEFDGEPAGLLDLYDYSSLHRRAGVGILVHSTYRSQGFAREALAWLSTYARDIAYLHQLYASIPASNSASFSAFMDSGFSKTGVQKDWLRRGDSYEDVLQMQLIL